MKVSLQTTLIAAGLLVLLYVANFIYAVVTKQSGGTFGDSFGAVNALFSGSALFFLVLAFISQREELQLVKEERNDTRKLLEGQEEINRQQKTALDRQSFEQSFNSMYSVFLGRLSELDADQMPNRQSLLYSVGERCNKILSNLEANAASLPTHFEIERARPTVFIFFYLHSLLEKNRLSESQLSQYNQLLTSCVSTSFGQTICYFAFDIKLSDKNQMRYYKIAQKYGCDRMLSAPARNTWEQLK